MVGVVGTARRTSLVSGSDPSVQPRLRELDECMRSAYNDCTGMKRYYEVAEAVNAHWHPGSYHGVIRSLASQGMSVLDLGCGSGHAWENLRETGVRYTGIDWSKAQIEENRTRFRGQAVDFLAASLYEVPMATGFFDLVISLYVLEHVVWPRQILAEMGRLTKPGGMMAILCPHYRRMARMPSLPHGGPGSLRDKLRRGDLGAAAKHVWMRWYWPHTIRSRYPNQEVPWLINMTPTFLQEEWSVDNDAVYFVDRPECVSELKRNGANDITEEVLARFPEKLRRDKRVCFIVAEKE